MTVQAALPVVEHLPTSLLRRLRATSAAGGVARNWWRHTLADPRVRPGQPLINLDTAMPTILPVPLTDSHRAALKAISVDRPVRLLSLLAAAGGLATLLPVGEVIMVATVAPDGQPVPVPVPLVREESRDRLVERCLDVLVGALRHVDGLPPDHALTPALTVAVEPVQQPLPDSPLVLCARITGDLPVVEVRHRAEGRLSDVADRCAQLLADILDYPAAPVSPLLDMAVNPPSRRDRSCEDEPAELDETARALAVIWAELLEVPVEPDDDFFELGGHSLLALELVSEIRDRITEGVTMNDIFEHPTLLGQAARLNELAD
ncbi:phosphopantetheine-binding protein [Micromonospora sp. NPDC049051]|uniref:phosphopantetheine-binding protein n=1 Tax=Micromonospora sp. NPDC049051 TaxID=3364264 RepID=UPI00371F62B6